MPGELGPIGPTIPWNPGAEYLQVLSRGDQVTYEDDEEVYLDLRVYVEEEFPVVYFDLQASGTETAQFVDSATIYLDLTLTGGECYSSSSGLNLDAEAWQRWHGFPSQRWEVEEFQQLLVSNVFEQFRVTEDDVETRWNVIGISTDQGC